MGVDWSDNLTREMIANQFLQTDNNKIVDKLQETVKRLEITVAKLDSATATITNTGNGPMNLEQVVCVPNVK